MANHSDSHQVASNGDIERDGPPSLSDPALSEINKSDSSSLPPPSPVAHSTPHHKNIGDPVVMETTDGCMNEEKDDESLREIPVNSVKTARSEIVEPKRRLSDLALHPEGLADSPKINRPVHSKRRKSSSASLDGQLPDSIAATSKSSKRKRSHEMSVPSTENNVGGENKAETTARKLRKGKKRKDTPAPLSGPDREKLAEHVDMLPPLQSNRKRGKVFLPPLPAIGEHGDTRESETNC